jgi:hypothetical protein
VARRWIVHVYTLWRARVFVLVASSKREGGAGWRAEWASSRRLARGREPDVRSGLSESTLGFSLLSSALYRIVPALTHTLSAMLDASVYSGTWTSATRVFLLFLFSSLLLVAMVARRTWEVRAQANLHVLYRAPWRYQMRRAPIGPVYAGRGRWSGAGEERSGWRCAGGVDAWCGHLRLV